MGWLDKIVPMLEQYRSGTPSGGNPDQDFREIAGTAPKESVAAGLAEAFRSNQTPPFAQMVAHLFSQSNNEQKAGVLNSLLSAVGPRILPQLAGIGGLGSLLGSAKTGLTPQNAEQISPEAVREIASKAEQHNPSVVDEVSGFYSQHPALVKSLGAAALGIAMSKIAQRHLPAA